MSLGAGCGVIRLVGVIMLCSWCLHVAHCVIVANASLTGRQWVAGGLSEFYSVSPT
jgi:hypothetical protein